ncbi:calcium-transporting atpase [Ceraceosorus bombacis]|uniref:Calcium-transporting ATPase n=1 Tax=Ceraceosorus bombacis TaxID=401625 RepID=A0A0P1BSU1_9BASI|nr:calcium-transporting atpase [Ceraceosorus bombacis]
MEAAWTKTEEQVLAHWQVDAAKGLSEAQVVERRTKYGSNELEDEPPTPLWQLILEQFKDQLVIILLASAVISFVLALVELEENSSVIAALVEPAVIFLILIANATVGVVQERNADQAIEALKEYSPDYTTVIRGGSASRIRAADVVPGDVITVNVGDKVPADARLVKITSSSFRVDQAILTGESVSVNKSLGAVKDAKAVKQDMTNILFSGTTIATGSATAVVFATGASTAIGDIHAAISAEEDEKTPLQEKLDDFGDKLAKVITIICILVWAINVRHFFDPSHGGAFKGAIYYFKIAVALAVAAIPEGLAAVITACLALGTRKMAKRNAIVRHLPSVETLGSTNVICSDKTGTLTTNQMSVTRFAVLSSADAAAEFEVEGTSFAPQGEITSNGRSVRSLNKAGSAVNALAEVCAVCNDANIALEKGSYQAVGQPTEASLKVLVEKLGSHDSKVNQQIESLSPQQRTTAVSDTYTKALGRILTLEFGRDRKSMSTLVRRDDGAGALLVKGAPEAVLDRCETALLSGGSEVKLTKKSRTQLDHLIGSYATQGLRVLALATVENAPLDPNVYRSDSPAEYVKFEQRMRFVGLVGMLDPPRPEVRTAIARCRAAGIRVICITGDNKATAEAICRSIGIFRQDEELSGKSYTGREFDDLSEDQKRRAVLRASLFSRTEPSHKSKLVELLQQQNLVVAMTGDGVNDAPALKRADIGIAMGKGGTAVAQMASDMVLADDNFATIESAVEEGRAIYNNTLAFIRYLISSNIGEVASIFITVLTGLPEALIPVQLLWVNLVTDGLPATALSFNPPDKGIMSVPPRRRSDPLVTPAGFARWLAVGLYIGFATCGGYAWWYLFYENGPRVSWYELTHFHQCSTFSIGCKPFEESRAASTISLSILVVIEMLNAVNALSDADSILVTSPFSNPFLIGAIVLSLFLHYLICAVPVLQDLFHVQALTQAEIKAVFYFSAPVVIIEEICKFITRVATRQQREARQKEEARIEKELSAEK